MSDLDDIVKEFLVESYENLDRLDRDLVALEKNPDDGEILKSIFRTIHTIKGTSGFLAFNQLGAVAHAGENLLVVAGRATRAGWRNHDRTAGDGGCGAPDAGEN